MNVIDAIKSRRSIRKWKKNAVPKKFIKDLVEAGKSAPQAYGSDTIEIIVVDDINIINKLLLDRVQLKKAPYHINSLKWAKVKGLNEYEKVAPPPLIIAVCGNTKKCPEIFSLIQNMSAATENILLATHEFGLGACWLYVYDNSLPETEKGVKKILNIPNNIRVLSLVAMGYPNEKPNLVNKNLDYYHHNKWQKKTL